jgi:hypothetical protein
LLPTEVESAAESEVEDWKVLEWMNLNKDVSLRGCVCLFLRSNIKIVYKDNSDNVL